MYPGQPLVSQTPDFSQSLGSLPDILAEAEHFLHQPVPNVSITAVNIALSLNLALDGDGTVSNSWSNVSSNEELLYSVLSSYTQFPLSLKLRIHF